MQAQRAGEGDRQPRYADLAGFLAEAGRPLTPVAQDPVNPLDLLRIQDKRDNGRQTYLDIARVVSDAPIGDELCWPDPIIGAQLQEHLRLGLDLLADAREPIEPLLEYRRIIRVQEIERHEADYSSGVSTLLAS